MSMNYKRKFVTPEIKSFNDKELWIEHFISTESRDRGGDIMRADGMKFTGVPVVLWQHGQDVARGYMPIAKPLGFSIGMNDKGERGIVAKTQYPNDEEGRKLYARTKEKFMPNWSIGYTGEPEKSLEGGGHEYKEWELLEYSNVAVPMNAEATNGEIPVIKELHFKAIFPGAPEGFADAVDFYQKSEPVELTEECKEKYSEKRKGNGVEYGKLKSDGIWEIILVNTDTKTIADDCAGPIAWQAMMVVIDKFLYSLHGCGGKKPARKLVTELAEAIQIHAETYADWAALQQQEQMQTKAEQISKVFAKLKAGDFEFTDESDTHTQDVPAPAPETPAAAPAPPVEPPVVETIPPPAPETTTAEDAPKTFGTFMQKSEQRLTLGQIIPIIQSSITANNDTIYKQLRKSLGRLD